MNRIAMMLALAVSGLMGQKIETQETDPQAIVRVETARDHLSLIEVADPVTMVAVGNRNAFSVEWRENRIFITPTEDGAKTNLFIWTANRRYAYELAPAAAVEQMHFVIDQKPLSVTTTASQQSSLTAKLASPADGLLPFEMLTRANPILIFGERETANRVEVSLREWYEKEDRVYLRYAALNRSDRLYQSWESKVALLTGVRSAQSLIPLGGYQLGEKFLRNLTAHQTSPIAVLGGEPIGAIPPAATSFGWLVVEKPRGVADTPAVLKIEFAADLRGPVAAVLVLPRRHPEVADVRRLELPGRNN
jgi:hypothetical protein